MVKRTVHMPNDDIKEKGNFKLVPEGTHRFQITDVKENDNDYVSALCEVVSEHEGLTLLHRLTLNPDDKFFWLTRLFLKAIGEPHTGIVEIDTDAWIGRQFTGRVEHSKDGKFSNIKEIIFKEGEEYKQPVKLANNGTVSPTSSVDEIKWEE